MTLAIDKMDGCGLSNKVQCEHLSKKTKTILYLIIHFIIVTRWSILVINVGRHIVI